MSKPTSGEAELMPTPAQRSSVGVPATRQEPAGSDTGAMLAVIERAAANTAIDVEKMERLLAMQERILAKEAERRFHEAMAKAQAEMPPVVRDARNPSTNSNYARFETVNEIAKPIYAKHGLSLVFSQGESPADSKKIRILCKVAHAGHCETHFLDLTTDDMGPKGLPNKTKIHGEGSAFSYGRRYLTLLIFNISLVGEDNDANRARVPAAAKKPVATGNTRDWFIGQIADIRDKAHAYAIDKGYVMPDEPLENWDLDHVPTSKAAMLAMRDEIKNHP